MLSRQSSISAMQAKVKKFAEKAEPAAAAQLQSKMAALSQRFGDACNKHKQKVSDLEQLKDKVEQFEKTTEKVQQFVLKRSQELSETDGPGKNVNELSQLVQVRQTETTMFFYYLQHHILCFYVDVLLFYIKNLKAICTVLQCTSSYLM